MFDQLTIDSVQGEALKQAGLDTVERNNKALANQLRQYAKQHSRQYGKVNSDNLRVHASSLGIYPTHRNFWGTILRGKGWKVIGRTTTMLEQGHARKINEYRWEGA